MMLLPERPATTNDVNALATATELKLEVVRQTVRLQSMAAQEALKLAQTETHRRLDILNGEHGRLLEERRQFVQQNAFDEWRRSIESRLAILERAQSEATGRAGLWSAAWGVFAVLLSSVVAVVVRLIWH